MTKPFYDRLEAYYSKVGEVLRGEADVAAIFPNASDIGGARENIYAEVLRMHVPSSCNVSLGGFLFDLQGYESKQIDILVTNDTSLRFDFHNRDGTGKSFACIDGCIAAVSVKSTLNTAQLRDALDNIASLPDKQPLEGRVNPLLQIPRYEDWPYKVIYASNGIGVDSIYESLCQYYDDHPEIPVNKRPNLIHVAGKYCIARVEEGGGKLNDGTILPEHAFFAMPIKSDAYGLLTVALRIQGIASSVSHMTFNYTTLIENLKFRY